MKSALASTLDTIGTQLRPILAERGYRARGRGFNRATQDGLTQVIELQMGRFDPPGSSEIPGYRTHLYGRFTINVGVYVPEYAEAMRVPAKAFVGEAYCSIRARIGNLSPDYQDIWWDIVEDAVLIAHVCGRIVRDGLPFLARFESRDAILAACANSGFERQGAFRFSPRVLCAAILATRGATDEARALLADQIEKNPSLRHTQNIRELAVRLGIPAINGTSSPAV